MTDSSDKEVAKVLFTQAHDELLHIEEDPEAVPETLGLRRLLVDLGFEPEPVVDPLTADHLKGSTVIVLGAPRTELKTEEVETIQHFVEAGGGLLLVSDFDAMLNPIDSLNRLARTAGLEFREYLNYHPTWLQMFSPHYITANIDRVKVKDIAYIICSNGAYDLAFTKATRSTIVACGTFGRGRVVAVGDVELFRTDLLALKGNKTLVTNAFLWLTFHNVLDIHNVSFSNVVKLGQGETVVLKLYNGNAEGRPQVECVLESDADALISEPARKRRSIPPGKTTLMQWSVRPQILGDQRLRLSIHIDGQLSLYFDQLPEMRCEAPGYLTMQIKDKEGELETEFQTGDYFSVEGALHWPTELEPPPYQLELELGKGLIERSYQPGEGVNRWYLQAAAPGAHTLILKLKETSQSLPATVTVRSSLKDQLTELRAAYIYPLDAEIAERLRTVDPMLSDEAIQREPFQVLSPEEFLEKVYDRETAGWLKGALVAARRERWYNPDLLNQVLAYLAPTYLPGQGSFAPYDPALASHLARLHPSERRHIEYNLLRFEESEEMNVKQNVAAYLLHEKYGHGFFYNHTRLGQQLATLRRHRLFERLYNERPVDYEKAADLIEDSAIIVNEGFAAWMELTFLGKLDREVRQAVYPRQVLLIEDASGLYERQRHSHFLQTFPPRFDSCYREGFEYLDFVSQTFSLLCAVRVLLVVTSIEFGILESANGDIQFRIEAAEIEHRLLEAEKDDARSHLRLQRISELLYRNRKEMQTLVRKRGCLGDCFQGGCPLETLIEENLGWRIV